MKITILGSGTCVPRLDRSACAVLVQIDSLNILLDLGLGTIRRLMESGATIFDLTHILFSHFHPDHTSELVSLLFATKYPDEGQRQKKLTVFGGNGLQNLYKGLQAAYGDWIVLPQEQVGFQEIDTQTGEVFYLDNVKITARPMNHRPESLAYRIEDENGKSIVYSGDTDESEALAVIAHEADLFICESAFPDELPSPWHLTPSAAGRIADQARVKQLVLTHLYPPCDEVDIAKQAARSYKGPVVAAKDLMSFEL
jgi:ribonuclease BN (tRNA processing enzyme)